MRWLSRCFAVVLLGLLTACCVRLGLQVGRQAGADSLPLVALGVRGPLLAPVVVGGSPFLWRAGEWQRPRVPLAV